MLGELLGIVVPVYLCAAVGFFWARSGRPYDTALITDLITTVGAPCLVFSSLVTLNVGPGEMTQMVGAALLALVCFAGIAAAILWATGLSLRSYLAPMIFGNSGNMGLPLCLFAFGEPGLALGACFFATTAITHFTAGQWIWNGSASFRLLFRTPLAWAALAAAAVIATDATVPAWGLNTTKLLGSFTIPLMQLTLGASLARLGVSHFPRTLALASLRIGMGFAIGVLLSWALGLEGVASGVFILNCSMPVAVFNYLLAERYGRSPEDIAALVVLSTLLSFATVPLILLWLL